VITLEQYFMGRDALFPGECTLAVGSNAERTVERINRALELAAADGVEPGIDVKTGNFVASGWRPRSINHALERTSNAAAASAHIVAEACDLQERMPGRDLARWALKNLDKLEEIGLWMEDPRWTPDWVHWQTRPPHSGLRVYRPSMHEPLAAALPEQAQA
jgi:hypothetical protein